WQWTYNFTAGGVSHAAKLQGTLVSDGVTWKMLLSKAGEFTDYVWYTGESNSLRTQGSWTLNFGPVENKPFLSIEWNRNVNNTVADIKYTSIDPDAAGKGGYIHFGINEEPTFDAFYDIFDNMDLAEEMLKYLVKYALDNCREDLDFLAKRAEEEDATKPQQERAEMKLIERMEFILNNDFERLTYTEAIEILRNSTPNKKKKFNYIIEGWGSDLQSEHERYLVEKHFKKPVILFNYPKDIKSFYMRLNEDGKTVAAMDILFPGIGEIVGGSQREERYDNLLARMTEMHIPSESMWWYLDTRRFGTVPHAGFGLGFERLVQFLTGMGNIRDVIPFPRAPLSIDF
ncbi:MAG: hypothetical protein HC795_13035, partial [Coleofasciculaceae cyanobacterium RL_1_1]|nr:hypothetical protein [Coleofasciculaceae cyanobacterium RL_1_1]